MGTSRIAVLPTPDSMASLTTRRAPRSIPTIFGPDNNASEANTPQLAHLFREKFFGVVSLPSADNGR
jgi:hypothetical protein